ncbi:MAG TPA: hypothetical protein VJ932_12530, partial [Alkalispirochaeta sp.]|nr:hypothetical protein [Alkalispirochaeta sp.]
MSSKISTTDDFVTFVQTAEAVSDILVHDGAVPLVLHPVGLPAFCAQSDALPDEISRLRSIAARDGVQVWNGGYTGASGIHLTTEEISWDLTWAHTNPWDSGFSRYVERSTTADFPVLLTATQAARLEEERSHPDDPLCVGYVGYTVEAPSSGVHQLWFLERGQWKWLSSRILNTSHNTEGVVPGTVDPVDCLHLIVPRSSAAEARENLVQIVTDVLERSMGSPPTGTPASTAGAPPAPRSAASAPRGTFFHSGIEYGRRWLNSSRAAA